MKEVLSIIFPFKKIWESRVMTIIFFVFLFGSPILISLLAAYIEFSDTLKIIFNLENFGYFFLIALIVIIISLGFEEWKLKKNCLNKYQLNILLLILFVYSSVLMGTIKSLIANLSQDSYIYNSDILKEEYSSKKNKIINQIANYNKELKNLSDLKQKVDSTETYSKLGPKFGLFGKSYDVQYVSIDKRLSITCIDNTSTDDGHIYYNYSICFDYKSFRYTINEIPYFGAIQNIIAGKDSIEAIKDILNTKIKIITQKITQWKANEFENENKDKVIGYPYFLYDSAMNSLGNPVNYLTPSNFITRFINFIESLLKYLYFGIFITFIAENYSKDKKQ